MKFEPYHEYKDSGVKWVDEIPKNWEAKKLKYIAHISTDKLNKKPDNLPYVGLEHIESWTGVLTDNQMDKVDSSVNLFHKGDILFGKLRPYLAKVVEAPFDGVCTSELVVFKVNKDVNSRFVFHQLLSHRFINIVNALTYGVKMPRANPHQIENMTIYVPPLGEQEKISLFLDKKTSEIDLTIEKDTRLIELLKEKRTVLINHLVTKGLDPMVKMKDSGVEWIGEIPEDWNARKLKFFVSKIGSGITPKGGASVYVENGIALLRSQNIHFDGLRLKNVSYITEETNKTMLNSVVKNKDVLLNITGASIGRCTYFENQVDRANVNQHVCIIRPKTIFYRFLNYVLMSNIGQDQIFSTQMGSSREGVNFEQIGNFVITYPPYEEQEAIANYLDKSTQKIDLTIQKIQEKINFLEEYKKSLIHHVVTGKVDVGEVAV
ncbi:restriction endonuclease subunit S [Methanobacterium formicicum]|uniref:Restriction endonuclease subunit S n=1 Tax=Methanobacterium formicicum TaxID=2162 RepID=A0A843ANR3_METFO|nr:restriction endonuclease subunit S [Methanobacterium formicicum]MBF4475456.1 restriction endonuclease subunit S [Methanobacterium formicicum]